MTISGIGTSSSAGVQSGTFTGGPLGSGTFARAFVRQGDTETIDTTRTNAAGRSVSDVVTVTRNADGSVRRDTSYTTPQGKTILRDFSIGVLQQGVRSVTGTITDADGSVEQVTGTQTDTTDGYDEALTFTNAAGQTANEAVTFSQSGSVDTTSVTGTNFRGGAIDQSSTTTVLSSVNIPAVQSLGTIA